MVSRLSKHIEQVLLRHQHAVLPSLGGFVLEQRPARYDAQMLLAYPPSIAIHFNEGLTHQDNLIVEVYAAHYGISMRRARLMLEDDVRSLRQELVSHRYYKLEGIGTLRLEAEGRLTFVAEPSARLNSASYGLSPVALPERIVSQSPSADDNKYLQLRIPKRAFGYASVVAVLMLTVLPWGNYFSTTDSFTASFVPSEEAVQKFLPEEKPAPIVETPEAPKPAPEPYAMLTPVAGRHYIIIATEAEKNRAEMHCKRAIKKNLPELGIVPGRRVYRVSAASFDTAAEAYRFLGQLPQEYREAWVYKHR